MNARRRIACPRLKVAHRTGFALDGKATRFRFGSQTDVGPLKRHVRSDPEGGHWPDRLAGSL